jgi:hypothetical protein
MNDREKLKVTGGDHRLAQVLVRPEVFSIHMKGLKSGLGSGQDVEVTTTAHHYILL